MRARLLVFALLGLALFAAMSLLVVSEAPDASAQLARMPQRLVAPVPALPHDAVAAPVALAVRQVGVSSQAAPPRLLQPGTPVEISPLAYTRCAYYAFHYADEAG